MKIWNDQPGSSFLLYRNKDLFFFFILYYCPVDLQHLYHLYQPPKYLKEQKNNNQFIPVLYIVYHIIYHGI